MLINQKGGDKSYLNELYNLNIFEEDSIYHQYLNPVNGIIFTEVNALNNYYFYAEENSNEYKLLHQLYHNINDEIKVSDKIGKPDVHSIGVMVGLLFINQHYNENITKLNNEIKNLVNKISMHIGILNSGKNINLTELNLLPLDSLIGIYNSTITDINTTITEFKTKYDEISSIDEKTKILSNLSKQLKYLKNLSLNICTENNILKETINMCTKSLKHWNTTPLFFNIILSLVYWLSNDREGYLKYYIGLQSILGSDIVKIPDDFLLNIEFKTKQFDNVVIFYLVKYKQIINLLGQSHTIYRDRPFSDCGETTLRNLINIVLFDDKTKNLNIENLGLLGANDDITEYYSVYDNMSKQFSGEFIFRDKKMTSRNAWGLIVENMDEINYCQLTEGTYKYNLDSNLFEDGEHNLLKLIKKLFSKITKWEDFKDYGFKNVIVSKEKIPNIYQQIKFIRNDYYFILNIYHKHYDISFVSTVPVTNIDLSKYSIIQQNILLIISNKLEFSSDVIDELIYYIDITNNILDLLSIITKPENIKLISKILEKMEPELIMDIKKRIKRIILSGFTPSNLNLVYMYFLDLSVKNNKITEINYNYGYKIFVKFGEFITNMNIKKLDTLVYNNEGFEFENLEVNTLILYHSNYDYLLDSIHKNVKTLETIKFKNIVRPFDLKKLELLFNLTTLKNIEITLYIDNSIINKIFETVKFSDSIESLQTPYHININNIKNLKVLTTVKTPSFYSSESFKFKFPDNLEELNLVNITYYLKMISESFEKLPNKLKKIIFDRKDQYVFLYYDINFSMYDYEYEFDYDGFNSIIHNNIEEISFCIINDRLYGRSIIRYFFNIDYNKINLPSNLKIINGIHFDNDKPLKEGLESIGIYIKKDISISTIKFPTSLKQLILYNKINNDDIKYLPTTINKLSVFLNKDEEITKKFSNSITDLTILVNDILNDFSELLPEYLENLTIITNQISNKLDALKMPKTIKKIRINEINMINNIEKLVNLECLEVFTPFFKSKLTIYGFKLLDIDDMDDIDDKQIFQYQTKITDIIVEDVEDVSAEGAATRIISRPPATGAGDDYDDDKKYFKKYLKYKSKYFNLKRLTDNERFI